MRALTTYFVIAAVVWAFAAAPVPAQQAGQTSVVTAPKLIESIRQNELLASQRSSVVDVKAIEKAARQTPPKQKSWVSRHKLAFVAIAIGVAAFVFVAFKYGKDCLKTDPEFCTLGTDEPCTCVEYKQNK